jgi:ribosomal protein S18 acetylase RimI-like enzyme
MNKTNDDAVKFTKAQEVHIPGMAQCHIKSFPGRFMTEMGCHWLCALYRFFIRHNKSICRIAVDADGKVIGLAVGGNPYIRDEFLNSALFRYPHLIFWKFLSKQLVRRVLLQELARKLQRKRTAVRPDNAKAPNAGIRSGNLLSICVLPECEGTGVGRRLIESFQLACKAEGYNRLTLSVLKQNSRAVAFYTKKHWRRSSISGDSIRFVLDL